MEEQATDAIAWVEIIVQAVMMIVGLLALYWKQRVESEHRFTKIEGSLGALEGKVDDLKSDHGGLAGQVRGISRSVAELKGKVDSWGAAP